MRFTFAILAVLALAGCDSNGNLTAQGKAQLQAACMIDGTAQPVAATILAALVPQSTPAVALDNATVHPAVQSYCASIGGSAVAVPAPAAPVAKPAA